MEKKCKFKCKFGYIIRKEKNRIILKKNDSLIAILMQPIISGEIDRCINMAMQEIDSCETEAEVKDLIAAVCC